MAWAGTNLKEHLVLSPCHGKGHLPLDQAAPWPIQPGLEHLQDGEYTTFQAKLFDCLCLPQKQEGTWEVGLDLLLSSEALPADQSDRPQSTKPADPTSPSLSVAAEEMIKLVCLQFS